MGVDVIAGGDVAVGEPDHLAVLLHGRSVGDWSHRELVSGGDVAAHAETTRAANQIRAGPDGAFDHRDVVGLTEQQGEVCEVCFFGHIVIDSRAGGADSGPKLSPAPGWLKPYSSRVLVVECQKYYSYQPLSICLSPDPDVENKGCGGRAVCYFFHPFRSGGYCSADAERAERPQNPALVRVNRGGQNNIKINPVFRGMVRRQGPSG